MIDALLIYNPAAGRIPVAYFIGDVIRTLNESGWRVEVAESVNGRHTTQLARMAAADNFRAVFAIGGDGTAGQAASGLIGAQTALAVIPGGTTNVWATDLGMKPFNWKHMRSLRQNARLLAEEEPVAIDVGMCNGQPFLLWAGIGLDALIVHKIGSRKRLEKYISVSEYAATTLWNVAAIWHGMNLRASVDDRRVDGHYLLAIATNIRRYALVEISPTALIDDGQMDLWLLAGSTLADALRHMFELLSGTHVASDIALRLPFRRARIESDTAFPIHMDGEPTLVTDTVSLEVLPRSLHVLIPRQARAMVCNASPQEGERSVNGTG